MQNMGRRKVLGGLGVAAMTVLATETGLARGRRTFFQRIGLPIGLQIYTLGPEAGRDIDATFAQVAAIGYCEIELPNLLGHQPAEVAVAARRAGLTIASVHLPLVSGANVPGLTLGGDPARIADDLGTLGAKWAVAPILLIPSNMRPNPGESFGAAISRTVATSGEDVWKRTAEMLNEKGRLLKPLGINVGYHNHNIEFAPVGRTTGWDILWHETQPDLVSFEVDLGWVATAGLDPIAFLRRTRGRVRLLHVKDVARDNAPNYRIEMKPAEVGSGTLDWAHILPEAYRAGVQHFLVEQEPPFTIPRMEAAAKSYAYLSTLRG